MTTLATIEIWGVPYDVEFGDGQVILHCPWLAEKLAVPSRHEGRHNGFEWEDRWYWVDVYKEDGEVVISAPLWADYDVPLDVITSWVNANIHAIEEIGYEVLDSYK